MKAIQIRTVALGAALACVAGACSQAPDGLGDVGAAAGSGLANAAAGAASRAFGSLRDPGHPAAAAGWAGLPVRTVFADAPDRGDLVAYPAKPVVRKAGPYTWHRADFSEEHALRAIVSGELAITAPSGERLRFEYDRHIEHENGDLTWIGQAIGGSHAQDAILTFGPNAVFGSIAQPDGSALRVEMQDGASWLVETDRASLAARSKAEGRYDEPDFVVPSTLPGGGAIPSKPRVAHAASRAVGAAASEDVVDVLVGYTPGFVAGNMGGPGGTISMADTKINNMVAITNQSYANSNVPMRVRLVHKMQVDYPDTTKNNDALYELTGFNGDAEIAVPPALQALRAAREQYNADLVTLLRDFNHPEHGSCGVAWLLGSGMQTLSTDWEPLGFSVVSDGWDGGYTCEDTTFAHELGHNMGLAHDIDTMKGDDGVLQNNEYGRYSFSFGYRTGPTEGHFYTVMAYDDGQPNQVKMFSNPRIAGCYGFQCGKLNQADNAQTLELTMPIIASFRGAGTQEPPPVQGPYVRNDVDGDGKADITWLDVRSRAISVWKMAGTTTQATLAGSTLTDGFIPLGLGDFNGDGRADLMATNGFQVAIGEGTGGGFVPVSTFSTQPPSGWDFAGIADLSGDGKSDVVWHNVNSGELYVWLMDGASIAGGRGGSYLPLGHRVSGVGDLDGDGIQDLVTTSSTDVRVAFGLGLGAYAASTFISAHPPALWTFGGTGDFNGDGKADVLWHNARSGELYYWQMSGATITGGLGNAFVPIGNRIVDVLDIDGDDKVDVLSVGADDVRASLGGATGFGPSQVIANERPGTWWLVNTSRDQQPRADLNGDGRSDVVWYNAWSHETYYWLMNGSSIVEQQGGSYLQAGSEPLAIADINGDGLPDILGYAGNAVVASLGQGGGGFQAGAPIADRPGASWTLAGVVDMNGDGSPDIVWHNGATGVLSTWLLDDGALAGKFDVAATPAGYAVLDIGDLNADGYVDVVSSEGTTVVASFGSANGQYAQKTVIAARPASDWALAGIVDINQDGKADITWHNQVSGELYSWVMSGAAIVGGSGGSYLPIGHRVLAMRDVTGDRRPDVLSTDGADVWSAQAIPGGGFNAAVLVAPLPAAPWGFVTDP